MKVIWKWDKKQDDHTLFCVPEFKFTENHTKVFEQNFYTWKLYFTALYYNPYT